MIKKVLLFAFIVSSIAINAQKAQRIGYIDMEYILENIPEYSEAQSKIDTKAIVWQNNIEKQQKEIEDLKAELNNEKVLLTKELIIEKEEDIQILEFDLKNLQVNYFGTNGDLYFLRQQLVQPIQDLVYNAIQDIATKRKYDFVLEKSTSLIMLYSNKKYDLSDLVIKSITREKKTAAIKDKQNKNESGQTEVANEESQKKLTDREIKQALLKKKIEDKKAAQLKKRKELKAAIEAKRQKRIQEIEDAKKAKEKKRNN
ncbi:MAG: OmpH family outer membrane protein [Lutibacter sp.]|nr:OmpH family outer membrane protein [Lutibacter sp.]